MTAFAPGPVAFGDVGPAVQELKKLGSEDPSYTTPGDTSGALSSDKWRVAV